MIQYLPIEHSFAAGENLYLVLCIWVHGYKEGRGNFQKKGMGKALLQAAEADVLEMGKDGLAAWGLAIPVWMKASWFRKQGYRKADRMGMQALMWKAFTPGARPPRWIKPKKKPQANSEKVTVTCLINGWCPAMSIACERAKRAAAEFDDRVHCEEIDTMNPETFQDWGRSDGLFIDDKEVRVGPPPSLEKIRKKIAKKVKKL
jgi:hypothetical protein